MSYEIRNLTFPSAGQGLLLEGKMAWDPGNVPTSGVVVCHPHPLYGGSMENNVVLALFDFFARAGYVTLAFHFRGVGRSQGRYGEGDGETDDVAGAIRFLAEQKETFGCGLALWGYSFGAWVGLRAAAGDGRIRCLGAVAPPLGLYGFDFVRACRCPVYVLSGDKDPFCPADSRESFLGALGAGGSWEVLAGADHFFWGFESEIGRFAVEVSSRHLPARVLKR